MPRVKVRDLLSLKLLAIYFLMSLLLATGGWLLIQTKDYRFAEVASAMFLIPVGLWGLAVTIVFFLAVHELGHLLAGQLVGLKFDEMVIGRLRWANCDSKLRFSEISGSWLDGIVRMSFPQNLTHRWRYVLYILGGPVLVILLCILIYVFLAMRVSPAQADRGAHLIALLFLSIIALAPLIPYTQGPVQSDGATLVALAKDWPAFVRSLAIGRIFQAHREQVPPEEWSEADLELALSEPSDKDTYPAGLTYRYYKCLMSDDIEGARKWIETALTSAPPVSGWFYIIRANAATFFGFYDRDSKRSGDALSALMPEMFPRNYVFPIAMASTRLAQGNLDESYRAATEAEILMNSNEAEYRPHPYEKAIITQILAESKPAP